MGGAGSPAGAWLPQAPPPGEQPGPGRGAAGCGGPSGVRRAQRDASLRWAAEQCGVVRGQVGAAERDEGCRGAAGAGVRASGRTRPGTPRGLPAGRQGRALGRSGAPRGLEPGGSHPSPAQVKRSGDGAEPGGRVTAARPGGGGVRGWLAAWGEMAWFGGSLMGTSCKGVVGDSV